MLGKSLKAHLKQAEAFSKAINRTVDSLTGGNKK
jgi:hypothetical protein